jgi:hypothetical protein
LVPDVVGCTIDDFHAQSTQYQRVHELIRIGNYAYLLRAIWVTQLTA